MNKRKVEDMVRNELFMYGPDDALIEIEKIFGTIEEQIWAGIVFGMYYSLPPSDGGF